MQKGLSALLRKYAVAAQAELSADGKTVKVDGKDYPVLAYESERRFLELRNLVLTGRIGNLCTYLFGLSQFLLSGSHYGIQRAEVQGEILCRGLTHETYSQSKQHTLEGHLQRATHTLQNISCRLLAEAW